MKQIFDVRETGYVYISVKFFEALSGRLSGFITAEELRKVFNYVIKLAVQSSASKTLMLSFIKNNIQDIAHLFARVVLEVFKYADKEKGKRRVINYLIKSFRNELIGAFRESFLVKLPANKPKRQKNVLLYNAAVATANYYDLDFVDGEQELASPIFSDNYYSELIKKREIANIVKNTPDINEAVSNPSYIRNRFGFNVSQKDMQDRFKSYASTSSEPNESDIRKIVYGDVILFLKFLNSFMIEGKVAKLLGLTVRELRKVRSGLIPPNFTQAEMLNAFAEVSKHITGFSIDLSLRPDILTTLYSISIPTPKQVEEILELRRKKKIKVHKGWLREDVERGVVTKLTERQQLMLL